MIYRGVQHKQLLLMSEDNMFQMMFFEKLETRLGKNQVKILRFNL
jgi:hypothetical protein